MPVKITVSQVRDALYWADLGGREQGTGTPTTSVLGQWFHEVLGQLVKDGATTGPLNALAEVEA
ncbi:MAG: hypothetical protein JWM11_2455, partial [Planctomycetaceae bacterium]|nr:hypothetical protein [Planctomycetaceae bacterium]